jgi:hypothetical protein
MAGVTQRGLNASHRRAHDRNFFAACCRPPKKEVNLFVPTVVVTQRATIDWARRCTAIPSQRATG